MGASARRVIAYAPGSTSNLGPGFDCLGVAFTGKGDRVTALVTEGGGVRVVSVSDSRIPLEASRNTAAIAAEEVRRRAGAAAGLELQIEKGLPLSGGMGGSAASAVAGAVAADAAFGARLSREDLLQAALAAESVVAGRHLDNIAPSLLGGAVLVVRQDPPLFTRVEFAAGLGLVLCTPAYAVETVRARAVLPAAVPRATAIAQASSLAGLLAGLASGEAELVRASMHDHIAEPARAALYPGYREARAAALGAGAWGVVISGAGPTVVAVAPVSSSAAVARALVAGYASLHIAAETHEAVVDEQGARVLSGEQEAG